MIDVELLQILRCPETRQTLTLADAVIVQTVNGTIAVGGCKNRGGQPVTEAIAGGLVRADGKFLYPIRNRIPILLIDEALPLG